MSVYTEPKRDTPPPEVLGDEASLREAAVRRLRKKQDFHTHALIYLTVMAFLWIAWAVTMPGGYPWPIWPMVGWGIGVAANAWDVYGRRPFTEDDVAAEMRRLDHR
jgi:2TM domain